MELIPVSYDIQEILFQRSCLTSKIPKLEKIIQLNHMSGIMSLQFSGKSKKTKNHQNDWNGNLAGAAGGRYLGGHGMEAGGGGRGWYLSRGG